MDLPALANEDDVVVECTERYVVCDTDTELIIIEVIMAYNTNIIITSIIYIHVVEFHLGN